MVGKVETILLNTNFNGGVDFFLELGYWTCLYAYGIFLFFANSCVCLFSCYFMVILSSGIDANIEMLV